MFSLTQALCSTYCKVPFSFVFVQVRDILMSTHKQKIYMFRFLLTISLLIPLGISLAMPTALAQNPLVATEYEQVTGTPSTADESTTTPLTQSAPASPEALLIADVNFQDVTASLANGIWSVQFSLKSTYGSQDGVVYGVVTRDSTGALVDYLTNGEKIFLPEGESVSRSLLYPAPLNLSTRGDVYIAAFNAQGLTLAMEKVGEVLPGAKALAQCSGSAETVSCTSEKEAVIKARFLEGSPFGAEVSGTEIALSPAAAQVIDVPLMVRDFVPGPYVLSIRIEDSTGLSLGSYLTEYIKAGDVSRIVSVAPKYQLISERGEQLVARVYAEAFSSTGASFKLTAVTGNCTQQETLFDGQILDFIFDPACVGDDLRVDLRMGDQVADTVTVKLGAAPQISGTEGATSDWSRILQYGLIALFVISILLILGKRLISGKKGMIAVLFILATSSLVEVPTAEAATYVIGGTARYVTCLTGGWPGCAEPDTDLGYTTAGTVTVPDAVDPGETYTISVAQSLPSTRLTTCSDGGPIYTACGPLHVRTAAYTPQPRSTGSMVYGQFVGGYTTLPSGWPSSLAGAISSTPSIEIGSLNPGTASGVFSRTAPATGTADSLTFTQIASANFSVRCARNCITYPYSARLISVPINAAASCAWQGTGYIDGRVPPGAVALHNSTYCSTPTPGDGSPNDSLCNAGNDGRTTVCCDSGADCFRFSCSCGAAPPPSGTPCWQRSGTRTVSAASCSYPMSPPMGSAFPACTAGNQGSIERRCDDDQPGLDIESTYSCRMCASAAPTLIMTGARVTGYAPDTLIGRMLAFVMAYVRPMAEAAPPDVYINFGESMRLTWTSTGTGRCTLTVPGELPRDVSPNGSTVVPALPVGTHYLRMTCLDATETQSVMDSVTVIVAATSPDVKICPSSAVLGNGFSTQLRVYYIANGTVNCANTSTAIDVTGFVNWSSSNSAVATVDNAGNKGLATGVGAGSATISTDAYLGMTAPGVTISVTCVPTNSCSSAPSAQTAANRCPDDTFTISDGCGGTVTCPGTRTCDFNWKEVGQ